MKFGTWTQGKYAKGKEAEVEDDLKENSINGR